MNSTQIPSDILITYSIDQSTGAISLVQKFPSGGKVPRQFSLNRVGNLLAVALQDDGRIVVIDRDVTTGMLRNFVATANVAGEVTCVVFNEP